MKNKIILLLIILLAVISVSAVSASENITDDTVAQDAEPIDEVSQDVPDEVISTGENPQKTTSKIKASNVVGYDSFTTEFKLTLTSNGTALSGKSVNITVDNVVYKKTTDKNGQAFLNIKLSKGTYNVNFAYGGDENTTAANGTSKITVKDPTKTSVSVADKNINYRQGLKNAFIVRLIDANGKAIKNQMVTFKVNGKTLTAKTDKNGYAEVYLKLKKGKYTVRYYFYKNAPYLASSGSFKITVKSPMAKGNGYWVWSAHMKSVNLKLLANRGTKHIFLHVHAISVHGKSAVISFIKKAHKYGIKVHMWMQVCCSNDKWTRPVNKDGSFKYGFLNSKIREAIRYSKIPGADGVHFDYVRFGGTAHLYKTSTDAINYFVKKASVLIHRAKPNCIVSAAVMPEPSMMHYYYGQDIPTMGKYIDAIVPMTYKGNYHQKTSWITNVVSTFNKQSKSAVIWAGLQSYQSDDNAVKLSYSELLKDARAAKAGGATGSVFFRVGITRYLNFKLV